MTPTATHSLRVSRTIRAEPDRLFRAWTDPEALMHWWRMDEEGWAFAGASIDLRVGGLYRLSMTSPDGERHDAFGIYREIRRPWRLVFTWDWENPAVRLGETLVTVELRPVGARVTEVVVTHERFRDANRIPRHQHGWTQLLTLLDRFHRRTSEEKGEQDMATRETIQSYFSSLKQKKGWESFLADDLIFTSFTNPIKRVTGREAYLESTRRFYSMIAAVEVRELIFDGDKACALTHYELRPPKGTEFSTDVAEVFTVRDGKIDSFAIYFDSAPFPK
jgi:uncharacterized protein YndB with AHSA1/START domain/ketosteroid isomerase-like protein